jgi:hypothetical protein
MEKRGFEQSLSVFICVHLWLCLVVTAKRTGLSQRPRRVEMRILPDMVFVFID